MSEFSICRSNYKTKKSVKPMKKFAYIVAILPILAGCSNVRTIGKINDTTVSRITARGLFSPSSTVIVASDPNTPGEIEVIAAAEQPGTLNAVATAGGLVGAAAVLRPARSSTTSNSNGGSSSAQGGSAKAKGGYGGDAVNISSNSSKSSSDSSSAAVAVSSSSSSAKNANENSNRNQVEVPQHVCTPKCKQHGGDRD